MAHIESNYSLLNEKSKKQQYFFFQELQFYILFISESHTVPPIYYIYYKAGQGFQKFTYIYHLVRDCKSRVDQLQNITYNKLTMPKVFVLRIGIVGNYTADSLKLISKKRTGEVPFSIQQRHYIRLDIHLCTLQHIIQYHFSKKGTQICQWTITFGRPPLCYVFKMTFRLKQLWRYVIFKTIFFHKINKRKRVFIFQTMNLEQILR